MQPVTSPALVPPPGAPPVASGIMDLDPQHQAVRIAGQDFMIREMDDPARAHYFYLHMLKGQAINESKHEQDIARMEGHLLAVCLADYALLRAALSAPELTDEWLNQHCTALVRKKVFDIQDQLNDVSAIMNAVNFLSLAPITTLQE